MFIILFLVRNAVRSFSQLPFCFFLSKLLKERLHSDGPQFHQYQQNKQSPLNSDGH